MYAANPDWIMFGYYASARTHFRSWPFYRFSGDSSCLIVLLLFARGEMSVFVVDICMLRRACSRGFLKNANETLLIMFKTKDVVAACE